MGKIFELGRNTKSIHGWIIIDKPKGYSSTNIVNRIKKILQVKKAGHAGTLDPNATGILAIAIGEATKTIQYLMDAPKEYNFSMILGTGTDTDDSTGCIIKSSEKRPSNIALKKKLKNFEGLISQVPPNFSAVRVKGQRAYKLSRGGNLDLKLKARNLWVEKLTFIDRISDDEVELNLVCGKGGYVRSIARDLGKSLGCYAHVENLRRIRSGPFNLDDAMEPSFIECENAEKILSFLKPIFPNLKDTSMLSCNKKEAELLKNGISIKIENLKINGSGQIVFVKCQETPVAICVYHDGVIKPKRVFLLD